MSVIAETRDVVCVVVNTIMGAPDVHRLRNSFPVCWLIHEWWPMDDDIKRNLTMRNISSDCLNSIKECMDEGSHLHIVFVCKAQQALYHPNVSSSVIYNGIPEPILPTASVLDWINLRNSNYTRPFTFLAMGIVCPRKNQLWTVQLFQVFCKRYPQYHARLIIVGARRERKYETDYLLQVRRRILF